MYHEAGIQELSKKQISRLLNGHPVRIKHGSHHKIHLSADHHKKLHRAHAKGSALTVTLDPFAIQHNQHLRDAVGMARKLTGTGPKGLKKFVKTTNALGHVIKSVGDYIAPVAKPVISGAVNLGMMRVGMAPVGDIYAKPPPQPRGYDPSYAPRQRQVYDEMYTPTVYAEPLVTQGTHMGSAPLPDSYSVPYGSKSYASGMKKRKPRKHGGTLLIDQPFTTRQAVNTIGSLAKDPVGTVGFGMHKHHKHGGRVSKVPKPQRVKRVMSEAQKHALAKGRHALRIKLNEMGAGTHKHHAHHKHHGHAHHGHGHHAHGHHGHHGMALQPGGYGIDDEC